MRTTDPEVFQDALEWYRTLVSEGNGERVLSCDDPREKTVGFVIGEDRYLAVPIPSLSGDLSDLLKRPRDRQRLAERIGKGTAPDPEALVL